MKLRFIVSRILGAIVVLILIAAACFAIFYLMPTNPAQLSCGKPCSPERLAEVERYLGVDQAWWKQLGDFLAGIIGGRTSVRAPPPSTATPRASGTRSGCATRSPTSSSSVCR